MTEIHTPICPITHIGYCVRERCNFWDEAGEECTADCFYAYESSQGLSGVDPAAPCTIYWTEDCD